MLSVASGMLYVMEFKISTFISREILKDTIGHFQLRNKLPHRKQTECPLNDNSYYIAARSGEYHPKGFKTVGRRLIKSYRDFILRAATVKSLKPIG